MSPPSQCEIGLRRHRLADAAWLESSLQRWASRHGGVNDATAPRARSVVAIALIFAANLIAEPSPAGARLQHAAASIGRILRASNTAGAAEMICQIGNKRLVASGRIIAGVNVAAKLKAGDTISAIQITRVGEAARSLKTTPPL